MSAATELPQTLEDAQAYEDELAAMAADIRRARAEAEGTADSGRFFLTEATFLELWPLLRHPIPSAFVRSIPPVKGKPYPSTGISSVQVQINRMDNVLTPLGWRDSVAYEDGGKLATVTITVGSRKSPTVAAIAGSGVLLERTSRGGVNQGSSIGNLYKGSWTNAAKRAIALVGPGHEIYLGMTDLDPDVSREVAGDAGAPADEGDRIGKPIAKRLVDSAWKAGEGRRLQLAASRLASRDVGDCSTKAKATTALTGALTFAQAEQLDHWLSEQADKQAAKEEAAK